LQDRTTEDLKGRSIELERLFGAPIVLCLSTRQPRSTGAFDASSADSVRHQSDAAANTGTKPVKPSRECYRGRPDAIARFILAIAAENNITVYDSESQPATSPAGED
jgi:hypothetical protein